MVIKPKEFTQNNFCKGEAQPCHRSLVFVHAQPICHTPGIVATYVSHYPGFQHRDFCDATGSKGLIIQI